MEKKKILIVEDHNGWRDVLCTVVHRAGYAVLAAMNGTQALNIAAESQPDLILMDIGLPGMNGDQATEVLKTHAATKHIPIVIQTAYGKSDYTQRALDAGAAEILHKPIRILDIQRILAKYLSPDEASTATPVTPGQTQPQPALVAALHE
jgi:CheY-like chemotaxis protein